MLADASGKKFLGSARRERLIGTKLKANENFQSLDQHHDSLLDTFPYILFVMVKPARCDDSSSHAIHLVHCTLITQFVVNML